jgi:long-chain acyl-CoA synthetase
VEVRDADGNVRPPGEIGSIWLRAKGAPRRYWNDPEETAATWRDGWVASGDLGYVDQDGDVFLAGRAKEMIIRGGYNIAPNEIEDALLRNPSVADAAVIGIPHDVLGQDVAAAIVPRDAATFDEAAVLADLRSRLAYYKVPRRVVILAELPRNAMGKVVKDQVRRHFG